ncbi:MAG: glycoside-pentoside-hexuronide (GPH):cation symporter [Saccharofermentanales bacterium]|jgi:sugar (glycoside-pentoside-hexuronide) transporter
MTNFQQEKKISESPADVSKEATTASLKTGNKMSTFDRRNMVFFGLGTVGRDMFYALEANALIYYLSNVLDLPQPIFVATSLVFTVLRIFDALNDPVSGLIIDNVRSRYGKFKPPMLVGAVVGAFCYMVFFTDFGLRDYRFVVVFGIAYILWDIFYGLNDIAYWSMLPSLSLDQKVREKMGAFARICANVGMYIVMVAWQPVTTALGNTPKAWTSVALVVTILMLLFQLFTIFGVREKRDVFESTQEKTTFRDMWHILTKNDQLFWTTISMSLFTIGYVTTATVSIYFMEYVFGNKDLYPVLALVVGVAQILALVIFPAISKHFKRAQLYFWATILVICSYGLFFFASSNFIILLVAALFLFIGQAFIQLLMLMFLEDTIEYGQWKLGMRNESVTLSVQPLINKIGGAISTGIVSAALVISGIKQGDTAATTIDTSGKMVIRSAMVVIPLVLIVVGYLIYRWKYKIDEEMYSKMLKDLSDRGELNLDA